MIRRSALLALATLAVGLLAAPTTATPPPPPPADPIAAAVDDLLASDISRGSCLFGAKKTIGIWPFDEDKVPVQGRSAQRVYDEIVARLVGRRLPCVDVLDGTAIGAIVDHLNRTGALQKSGGNVVAALETANRKVDFVVMAQLYGQEGRVLLGLRAIERASGRTVAQTRPTPVPAVYLVGDIADLAMPLDGAIGRAAHHFALSIADLKAVRVGGVFYSDTAAQPPAGRYVGERLVAALTTEIANPLSGRALKVVDPRAGATVPPGEGEYELSGHYWPRGAAVDLKLAMRRADGATHSWAGRIRAEDFSGLTLKPINPSVGSDTAGQGPFLFELTTPRGRSPVYRPGEELTLSARTSREAWVWCFYVDAGGVTTTVLPNPHRKSGIGNRLAAGEAQTLPDPKLDPFKFVFTADTLGEEIFRCFATSRDVRKDLPASFFPDPIAPIPAEEAGRLTDVFMKLPDVEIGEASVTVNVTR